MEVPFGPQVPRPYASLVAAAVVAATSGWLQTRIARRHLRTTAVSESPIVEWELAGTKERMDEIVGSWDARARGLAGLTLAIDVPFLAAYGFGFSYAAWLGAETFDSYGWDTVAGAFAVVTWTAPVAAALDVVENVLLARTLGYETGGDSLPMAIKSIAKAKFLLSLKVAAPVALVGLAANLVGCRSGCLPG